MVIEYRDSFFDLKDGNILHPLALPQQVEMIFIMTAPGEPEC